MMRLETPTPPLETPERSLVRLPRRAGPGGRAVRCQHQRGEKACGNILAVVEGEYVFYRDGGTELTATLPAEMKCDRCGHRSLLA
jgi:hypothetical protein